VLSVHVVDGWEEGCEVSLATLRNGGLGHTIGLWATDEVVLDAWFLEKPANRIVVNGPTSMGAVGYSTNLTPALSLGCGPQAGNITSDNLSARHLINIKRVAFTTRDWEERYVRDHERAARLSGDRAPRGSGLPGDPGLSGAVNPTGQTLTPVPGGNWPGNPPVEASLSRGRAQSSSASGASSSAAPIHTPARGQAPRFTGPRARGASGAPRAERRSTPVDGSVGGSAGGSAASATATLPAPPVLPPPDYASQAASGAGPYVGLALTPVEIQGILASAGAGCALGPCQACQHHDSSTGACHA